MKAKISAIEYVFPTNEISNEALLAEFPDYNFKKFEKKIGIKKRYVVGETETALDLAEKACEKLFKRINRTEIDYLIYCTQSPEYILPTSACVLQGRLKLNNELGAFDFNLGCSGYTYGLQMAKGLVESNQAKKLLLVTAETYSKFLHPGDASNRAIFGDAASATLIEASDFDGIGDFVVGTAGEDYDKLIIKNGAAKNAVEESPELKTYGLGNQFTDNHLYMDGPGIFNFTTEKVAPLTEKILSKNRIEKGAVDQFILHQANSFMLNFIRNQIGIEKDRFYNDLQDGGNTVSNTIPIALKKYIDSLDEVGQKQIAVVGFGVGLSWSGGMITINNKL